MAESVAKARARIESVDLLRGVIMVIMALDHVRDYFGMPNGNPTDPATTTVALFFTRWVTHVCAPVFFLLAGTGAWLALKRRGKGELSRFLVTRGTWLIFIEIVVLRCLGYQFNFDYHVTLLAMLWALGWAMIVLAGLVYLPIGIVAAIGAIMIATHNLFDSVDAASLGAFGPLWSILHTPGVAYSAPGHLVFVAYPLVPWIGVTAIGYSLGQVYGWRPARRRAFLAQLGLSLTAAFMMLRALNVYGDPVPWSSQRSPAFTVLSFLNVSKYPPSFLFLLMTLGPALIFLSVVDGGTPRALRPALVVGKVPMLYFLVHFPLIHLLAVVACYIRYRTAHWMFESPTLANYPFTQPPGWGFGLPGVYLVWAAVVVALYPACRWYAALKARRHDWWLSYL